MSHPGGNSDAVPTAVGPMSSGYGPYGPPPGYLGAPVPPVQHGSPPRPPARGRLVAVFGATALISAVVGGLAGGGVVAASHRDPTVSQPEVAAVPPPPTAAEVHEADVRLCTAYTIANAAIPVPQKSALDVFPVVDAMKWGLSENPDASPEIRDAIGELVKQTEGQLAEFGKIRTRGYAEPPAWNADATKAADDRVWDVCKLES
jgi:hypothetical protein